MRVLAHLGQLSYGAFRDIQIPPTCFGQNRIIEAEKSKFTALALEFIPKATNVEQIITGQNKATQRALDFAAKMENQTELSALHPRKPQTLVVMRGSVAYAGVMQM